MLTGTEITELLSGVIHEKTQVGPYWVDLTVSEVHRYTKRGRLDFGGSEYATAQSKALHPHKKSKDDKYGWWQLHQGLYLVVYNESLSSLKAGQAAQISPHPRLLQAGAYHASSAVVAEEKFASVLHVCKAGCAIKENSRVSRLQVWSCE